MDFRKIFAVSFCFIVLASPVFGEGIAINSQSANIDYITPPTAGLEYEWDAQSLSLSDSEYVSSWTDDTSSISLTPEVSGETPVYDADAGVGGNPSVEFDGVDDGIKADSSLFTAVNEPLTVAFVFQSKGANNSQEIITVDSTDLDPNAGAFSSDWIINSGTSIFLDYTNSVGRSGGRILVGVYNGANSKIRINGKYEKTGDVGGDTMQSFGMGQNYPADERYYKGEVAEVRVYSRELSDTEIAELEKYWINYWNLSI